VVASPAAPPCASQTALPERFFDGSVPSIPAVGRLDFLSSILPTLSRRCRLLTCYSSAEARHGGKRGRAIVLPQGGSSLHTT
jgi:hypothetical protein